MFVGSLIHIYVGNEVLNAKGKWVIIHCSLDIVIADYCEIYNEIRDPVSSFSRLIVPNFLAQSC